MTTPLLENILNQANALGEIAEYQFGSGRVALERAATILQSKKRIVLSGMGASSFACIPFQYLLAQRGFQVTCVESSELLYFLSSFFDEDTAVVLVSRSGESVEVKKLLPMLRETGAAVLGVVNVKESSLSSQADQAIVVHSPADQLVAIQTYTGTLATFALLQAAVVGELEQARDELEQTIDLLTGLLPEWVHASEGWSGFLQGTAPLYLLGRGAALGAVAEGVLLMHETAKAPAVGMSVAQFRHGPVEVVDREFRGIVIGTQAATEELDTALGEDLTKMGGQVRSIGLVANGSRARALCAWPTPVPERFAPIFETIPLQIAAYRKAELNGIRPGDFRWAPAVTSSETGFSAQTQM